MNTKMNIRLADRALIALFNPLTGKQEVFGCHVTGIYGHQSGSTMGHAVAGENNIAALGIAPVAGNVWESEVAVADLGVTTPWGYLNLRAIPFVPETKLGHATLIRA